MNNSRKRPVYLNLIKIRMPVMAVVSILHRASGVLWIVALPFLLYALDLSLRSPQSYQQVMSWLHQPLLSGLLILWLWLLLHHFFAGIRFLLLDMDVAISRTGARRAAWLVHLASVLSLVLLIGWLQ